MKLIMENWRKHIAETETKSFTAYHGSAVPIKKFDRKFGAQGVVWFSIDRDNILRGESGAQSVKYIMTVELTVNNPAGWDEYDEYFLQQLEESGYDSVELDENWIIFDPENVKWISTEKVK